MKKDVRFRLRDMSADEAISLRQANQPGKDGHTFHPCYRGTEIRFVDCAILCIPAEFQTDIIDPELEESE